MKRHADEDQRRPAIPRFSRFYTLFSGGARIFVHLHLSAHARRRLMTLFFCTDMPFYALRGGSSARSR